MKKYTYTEKKDTRSGFGAGLAELGKTNENVVALCADLIGSLKMDAFKKNHPERFFQIGIAEANIAEARGEAEAINIINQALANNPYYLEWLKIQKWDGILPLVTGGDGATPFIEIPTDNKRP